MKEYERFDRIGTTPHRSYYIPFAQEDVVRTKHSILDRTSSSRFTSLDGVWQIKQLDHVEDFNVNEKVDESIPVPSCVQMHGFDQIQYLNTRYPFPVMLPHLPYENPCWHYRRTFNLKKQSGERYYINFEGVDSAFYIYINGEFKGYSQISHSTSEFDITDLAVNGENTIDVLVLKWCISTYLECQDKFRFSGIFRNVYMLTRPEEHITDYKIETRISDKDGIFKFINESPVDVTITLDDKTTVAPAGKEAEIVIDDVKLWTADEPNLYTAQLYANNEKIIESVGFREVSIDGKVFKINGEPVKLKGVNRHDFHCETAATVSLEDLAKDIHLMKELNVNAVRTVLNFICYVILSVSMLWMRLTWRCTVPAVVTAVMKLTYGKNTQKMNSLLMALQTDTPHLLNVTKTVRVLSYGHSVMKALSGKHFSAVQTISNEEIIQDLFIMRDCRMLTLNIITLNLWIWSA